MLHGADRIARLRGRGRQKGVTGTNEVLALYFHVKHAVSFRCLQKNFKLAVLRNFNVG